MAAMLGPLALTVAGCSSAYLTDCTEDGSEVLGRDVPRIRSSHLRMQLGDASAAAAQVVPYAAMAALAYAEDKDCGHPPKISADERRNLEDILNNSGDPAGKWERIRAVEKADSCEDELGLFYHVWKRRIGNVTKVVVAFRGTWGFKDWYYGNARWFTRFITQEDQYIRARRYSHHVIDYFRDEARQKGDNTILKFYSTGHSLGGGLAQNVLYDRPMDYDQAYTFDPSPVTGYTDQDVETRIEGCSCIRSPGSEPRIHRIYESYEILTHLRFWHKLFFKPHRHIYELRFAFSSSPNLVSQHSMVALTNKLAVEAGRKNASQYVKPWYAGSSDACTDRFEKLQKQSCARQVKASDWNLCPQ